MSTIKTNLRTAATDDQGNVNLALNKAFSGVFSLGLLLGSQDPDSKQFPMDDQGLQKMKCHLENMAFDCLSGLSGIGAIIASANMTNLIQEDINRIGLAINNLALLGMEAQYHLESIEMDICRRIDQQAAQNQREDARS